MESQERIRDHIIENQQLEKRNWEELKFTKQSHGVAQRIREKNFIERGKEIRKRSLPAKG